MTTSKAARRYAAALLGFAIEQGKLDNILKDVQGIRETYSESRDLAVFLKSPVIKPEQKLAVLSEIFKSGVSSETWKFLELLAEKSRLDLLQGVMVAFIDAYHKHAGIIEAEIIYSEKPQPEQLDAIQKVLEKQTGKTVKLSAKEDPAMIGGVMVRLNDTVIDGSVRNKLQQLEQMFSSAAI